MSQIVVTFDGKKFVQKSGMYFFNTYSYDDEVIATEEQDIAISHDKTFVIKPHKELCFTEEIA